MSRLPALEFPFEADVGELLAALMPPGAPPIGLFRTMARNMPMTAAMHSFGSYELGRRLSVSLREREIVILRTCACGGAEYEWGVHVDYFARRAEFTAEEIAALTDGRPERADWTSRELLLIGLADSLLSTRDVPDELWVELAAEFTDVQLLDLIALCGWYQAISLLCRALRVDLEPDVPRFADFDAISGAAAGTGEGGD